MSDTHHKSANEKQMLEMLKTIGENIDRRDRLIEKLQKENDLLKMRNHVLESKLK